MTEKLADIERKVRELIEVAGRPTYARAEPREHWVARKIRMIADDALRTRPTAPADEIEAARGKLTPEYLAMTPLQKWETLTLHGLLGTDEPWIADMRETLSAITRNREGELRTAVNDGVATLAAVRATASGDEWAECAQHFHDLCGETIRRMNAALSSEGGKHG